MPVINVNGPLAAGVEGGGKALEGYLSTRASLDAQARDKADWQERKRRAAEEAAARKREELQRSRERGARTEFLTRRAAALEMSVDIDPADAFSPQTQAGVGNKLRGASQQNQHLSGRIKDLRRLVSQMSPEDAQRTIEEQTADMRAQFLQAETGRLQRDIEDAAGRGIFGDDENGQATRANLSAMAQQDPLGARRELEAARKEASRKVALEATRQRVTAKAQEWIAQAQAMGDIDERALSEADALFGDFLTNPNMDPQAFTKELRAKLFSGGPPKVQVPGLKGEIVDRSGWSKGGYMEDMTPRQRKELWFVAKAIVEQEMSAEADVDQVALALAAEGGSSAPPAGPSKQERIDAMMGDLALSFGWENAPDDEVFRRMLQGGDSLLGDVGWQSTYKQYQTGQSERSQERAAEQNDIATRGAQLPNWSTFKQDAVKAERVIQGIRDLDQQAATPEQVNRFLVEMGVNPTTVSIEDVESWQPKDPADIERADIEQSRVRRAQIEDFPLSTPEERKKAELDEATATERAAGRRRAAADAKEAVDAAPASKYPGIKPSLGKGADVELEVYAQWLEQQDDPTSKQHAKAIRAYQKQENLRTDWSRDELRAEYAKRKNPKRERLWSGTRF